MRPATSARSSPTACRPADSYLPTRLHEDGSSDRPTPTAVVEELGGDAVVLQVRYWVSDPRWNEIAAVRSRFARAAKERLEAADIAISPASKRELEGRIALDANDPGEVTTE